MPRAVVKGQTVGSAGGLTVGPVDMDVNHGVSGPEEGVSAHFHPASSHIVNPQFKGMRKTCVIVKHFDIAFSSWLFSKATCI